MTLPGKRSRRIRVNDVGYRYRIDALSTVGLGCCRRCGRALVGHGKTLLEVVVGLEEDSGQILKVHFPPSDETRSLTPKTVAALIDGATRQGWRPDCGGPPLELDAAAVLPDQSGLRPTCG